VYRSVVCLGDVAVLKTAKPLPSTLPFIPLCLISALPSLRNEDLPKLYSAFMEAYNNVAMDVLKSYRDHV
jgi:hypothetical protein